MRQNKKKFRIRQLTLMSSLAAVICVASFLYIPIPVSEAKISLVPLIVLLIGLILSPVQAGMTVGIYLLIGCLGIPVFAGTGGFGKLIGPVGGFYWGFILAAVGIAMLKGKKYDRIRYLLVCILVGIPLMYIPGAIQMKIQLGIPWMAVWIQSVIPFVPFDIIKAVAAVFMVKHIQHALKEIEE